MSPSNTLPSVAPGDPSWWFNEALTAEGSLPSSPSLTGKVVADVAIVGGGFTGLWTALALRERAPELRVVLIEAAQCGSGASGKNGGKCHGYWASLAGIAANLGPEAALDCARAGTRAQDAIRAFATAPGRDVWWREAGNVRVSTTASQDAKLATTVETARRLGVPDTAKPLSQAEVASFCKSPAFRGGVFLQEGANLHPARLARELRRAAIDAGVTIYEHTPMTRLEAGSPSRISTPDGEIVAREVILATNIGMAGNREVRPYVTVFSSYALMSEPVPEQLQQIGWTGEEGFADGRMFLHYFRKTPDGRVLMGSGSGPISFGGSAANVRLKTDAASAARAEMGLRRLLPGLNGAKVEKAWGGGIDVSSDRLPFFRTLRGTRVHYACGYSGHGVNPTYIGGQCLASLVLNAKDEWTSLPFCTRELSAMPPEPFRFVGGRLVQWGILGCEEADERGHQPKLTQRAAAAVPKLFGLRIGTR